MAAGGEVSPGRVDDGLFKSAFAVGLFRRRRLLLLGESRAHAIKPAEQRPRFGLRSPRLGLRLGVVAPLALCARGLVRDDGAHEGRRRVDPLLYRRLLQREELLRA